MRRYLTLHEKQLAIQLHVRGFNNTLIARRFNCNRMTIGNMISSWKKGYFLEQKARAPRRLKLSAQQVYNVHNYFVKNPFSTYDQCVKKLKLPVNNKTIGRVLSRNGVRNYVASYKDFLSIQNQIKRLKFAIKYKDWTAIDWLKVSFLDEKTIQTYSNGKVLVKRKLKERYDSDKIISQEKQNTKNKINLVGLVSSDGPNMLYSVSTKLKSDEFEELIRTRVEKIVRNKIVLMDNASIHSNGLGYLIDTGVDVLDDFPPKSPDLNIIENVWGMLQKKLNIKLRHVTISTKEQLLQLIEESWSEIPVDFIKNCILSMPDRLNEIIKMKGKQTHY